MPEEIIIHGRTYQLLAERTEGSAYLANLQNDLGEIYPVEFKAGFWRCGCDDFYYRHKQCKHIFELRLRREKQASPLLPEQQTGAETREEYQETIKMASPTAIQNHTIAKQPTAPAPSPNLASSAEKALIRGDLSTLSPEEKLSYYKAVCESLGLNPLTQPFGYLVLQGKEQLYARKACTDQLRSLRKISVTASRQTVEDGILTIEVEVQDGDGRQDRDLGCVVIAGLKGNDLANARMKAMTKAKRRATLSICGLGWLDETELETIPSAKAEPVPQATKLPPTPAPAPAARLMTPEQANRIDELARDLDYATTQLQAWGEKHWKTAPRDFSYQQANEAIGRLEAGLAEQRAKEAKGPVSVK